MITLFDTANPATLSEEVVVNPSSCEYSWLEYGMYEIETWCQITNCTYWNPCTTGCMRRLFDVEKQ
jgi:hypothetical protein